MSAAGRSGPGRGPARRRDPTSRWPAVAPRPGVARDDRDAHPSGQVWRSRLGVPARPRRGSGRGEHRQLGVVHRPEPLDRSWTAPWPLDHHDPKSPKRPGRARLDRAPGDPQRLGGLGLGQIQEEPRAQDLAIVVTQAAQGGEQLGSRPRRPSPRSPARGRGPPGRWSGLRPPPPHRQALPTSGRPTSIACLVGHDAQDPRTERCALAEPRERGVRLEERILDGIVGIGLRADEVRGPHGDVLVATDEDPRTPRRRRCGRARSVRRLRCGRPSTIQPYPVHRQGTLVPAPRKKRQTRRPGGRRVSGRLGLLRLELSPVRHLAADQGLAAMLELVAPGHGVLVLPVALVLAPDRRS